MTLKEVFERVIVLETKMDSAYTENKLTRHQFRVYVGWIVTLLIIDILQTIGLLFLSVRDGWR